jgi:hypothetical protein
MNQGLINVINPCILIGIGRLAQLAEHPVYTGKVIGSSPIPPTTQTDNQFEDCLFFVTPQKQPLNLNMKKIHFLWLEKLA